jgi:hypothetical protein
MNYLPGLALNCDPLALCLLSSWDYRHEPLVPGFQFLPDAYFPALGSPVDVRFRDRRVRMSSVL